MGWRSRRLRTSLVYPSECRIWTAKSMLEIGKRGETGWLETQTRRGWMSLLDAIVSRRACACYLRTSGLVHWEPTPQGRCLDLRGLVGQSGFIISAPVFLGIGKPDHIWI